MEWASERESEVRSAVDDIRAIEAHEGVTRESLEHIKRRLIGLAARRDLFGVLDFPPPAFDDKRNSCLYRLSEDVDQRFALYVNSSRGTYSTPAHNHTTWAVIVGVVGEQLNRLYERSPDGAVTETGQALVRRGTGVAFLPDDLHSIHVEAPLLNFYMYGLALERLDRRECYDAKEGTWRVFPPHTDIREARPGRR